MRVGIHNNRRHVNHSRLALPKFIAKCRFPCLRRYADSDAGSDLQQESLLDNDDNPRENDSYHMTGRDWDRDEILAASTDSSPHRGGEELGQENIVPITHAVRTPQTPLYQQQLAEASVSTATSMPRPLADNSNISPNNNHQLYQMPKFNSRMWQDGFGRFRRDTIPRRDNLGEPSPVPSHRESVHADNMGSTVQTWYSSPMFLGLGLDANSLALSQKSSNSTLLSDVVLSDVIDEADDVSDDDEEEDMWHAFENNGNLRTTEICRDGHSDSTSPLEEHSQTIPENSYVTERPSTACIALPERSSSLAQILLSLPDHTQHNPYAADNQTNATSTQSSLSEEHNQRFQSHNNQSDSQWHFQDQNQCRAHVQSETHDHVPRERSQLPVQNPEGQHGHPSVFEVLDRLQRNIQDNPIGLPPEGVHISASQDTDIVQVDTSDQGSDQGNQSGVTNSGSAASTVSSTWSNQALIQHILDALTNNTQGSTTNPRSLDSTQSSASSASHRNWYFYDRRLVPNRSNGPAGTTGQINQAGEGADLDMMQPPSYEEAQTSELNLNLPGINIDLLTQLGLLPSDPPPPYPGSDITPPPPYDTGSRNSMDYMSEVTSMHTDSDTMDSIGVSHNSMSRNENRSAPSNNDNALASNVLLNLDVHFSMTADAEPHRHTNNQRSDFQAPDIHMNDSDDSEGEGYADQIQHPPRSNLLGLGGRPPPVRWNRGMGLDRWASTHNWASQSTQ